MLPIAFKYKILKVDNELKMLEVEYSAHLYETVVVSMPIPFDDVSVEDHFRSYAPMSIWIEARKTHREFVEGDTGEVAAPVMVPPPPDVMPDNIPLPPLETPPPLMEPADVLKMIEDLKTKPV